MTSLPPLTEEQLQEKTIALAHARGWLVHHDRPAPDPRQGGKFRTVIDGDPGFPDLVLARGGRVILAELKSTRGRVSPAQQKWLDAANPYNDFPDRLPGEAEVYTWRPADWTTIEETLA